MLDAFTRAPDGVRTSTGAPHINDVSRRREVLGGFAPPPFCWYVHVSLSESVQTSCKRTDTLTPQIAPTLNGLGRGFARSKGWAIRFLLDFRKVVPPHAEKKMPSITNLTRSPKRERRSLILPWKPTILIAEDSLDSREMMEVLLKSKGYRVLTAENGERAVEIAVRNNPDAVLLDLQLPKLDGLSVTRSLRELAGFENVPIIILSGHDPHRYRQEAMDAGCDEYLLKPINFDGLQRVLDRLVPRERQALVRSA